MPWSWSRCDSIDCCCWSALMQFAWAIQERWACKQQLIRTQPQIHRHFGEARIAPALSVGQQQHNFTNNSSSSRASNAAARQTTFCTCSTAADRSSIESPHDLSDQQQHRHDQEHDQPSVAEGSKQLLLSIQQAANVQQLQAILGPCWTQVDPVHATAALKQLVLLQLQQTQQQQPRQPIHWQQRRKQAAAASSESLPESHHPQQQQQSIGTCQDPRVTELGLQLLHSSVQGSEPAAVSVPTQATQSAVTDGPQSSSLSAAQASDILHAVAQLQLVPEAAESLLHLLLQHAIQPLPGTASLTAEQLLQLLQGAVWLLGCNQQQQQQQTATTDVAVSSEPGSAPGAQAEHTSQSAPQAQQQQQQQQQHTSGSAAVRPMQRPPSPQQQHALLEAKRQQLLQRSNPRLQQQQVQGQGRHSAVQQLLLQVLKIWCQQLTAAEGTARDAEAAMSSQQLMHLLSLLLELRLLPEPVCLQQLLQLAGLQQQQHHHHHLQQQQGLWPPADAAAVLTKLVDLAKLAHSTAQSSSSTVQLLGIVQQHAEQLLLLALGTNAQSEAAPVAADASAGGRFVPSQQYTRQQQQQQQQQQKWPGTVGLSAVSDLLALTATSSSSSSNAPAASNASGVQLQQQRQVPVLLLLSPSTVRVLMDTLLSSVVHPLHSSRQQQQQQQQEGAQQRQQRDRQQRLPQDVLSSADILAAATTASELFQLQRQWDQTHQQQQQRQQHGPSSSSSSSDPATSTAVDNRVVRPLCFQLWLQEYVSCALHPKRRLQDVTASELTALLGLLVRHKAHMPPWWLGGAEERVLLLLLQVLCAARTAAETGGVQKPVDPLGAAAKLLHGWVQLLQVQPRRCSADAGAKASSSGGRQANSSSGSYIDNSSSSSSSGGSAYKPYFLRSSWFMRKACTALQPALQAMDTTSLGLTAIAVAQLGVPQELQQGWVQAVLAAASAAADRADCDKPAVVESAASAQPPPPPAAAAAAPLATEVAEPPPAAAATTTAQPHQDIRLPGEAVVNLLQSLALLRVRPIAVLLQRLLLLLRRDMVLERGPVLVGLLVVLSQLRYRPGPEWLRAVLLRLQGRLRLLSFDHLTQLCWCLTLLGIQPPQAWQDDFMDAAAVHIIAERRRQQQWNTWHKQQQQQQRMLNPKLEQAPPQQQQQQQQTEVQESDQRPEGLSVVAGRPRPGHPSVHPWQLQLMHWAILQVWRYRSTYRHGKLQWRAVRELNRAVWRLPQQKALQQLQAQFKHHQQQQQQQQQRGTRLHERQGSKTSQGAGESKATMRSAKRQRLMLSSKVAKLQWVMQARKAKGQAIKRHRRTMAQQQQQQQQQRPQQQELGSIAQQQQQHAAAGGGSSRGIAAPVGGRQLTSSSSSSSSGTYSSSSSSSRVRQGRWQLRGRAHWVDAALWPKQWQLATLPAQQYQGQGLAGR